MATRLLIVGGVAGGASAAARARRIDENAEITVFERGEYISFANCGLPYYIGEEIKEREDLLVTSPELLKARFRIDVRLMSEVTGIDAAAKTVEVKNHRTGETYKETYDKLILSPGAAPIRPPMPGVDLDGIFTLRNIPDTDRIKSHVVKSKPKAAVVVGGGFIGLEMAEVLATLGVKVTIVEMLEQVMPPIDVEMAAIVQDHLRAKGVALRLGVAVKAFRKDGAGMEVELADGHVEKCDMVILSVGVKPEVGLAKSSGLEIGPRGGIKVDETMRTSNADIFAVGDAVETMDFISGHPTLIPLAGPANRQGRIAADNALGRDQKYRGTQGTAIVRVFDLSVASTGANEKTLARNNIPHRASFTHSASHATYFPGAKMMSVKLLFAPDGGKILGAQIVGADGVDKRIDVLATALRAGMTVFDLEELELAYAPPYSSAKDPVNMAGFVAANILRGDSDAITSDELATLDRNKYILLDVRNKPEMDSLGAIEGAVHIPLHELRNRLGELDRNKTIVTYCAIGLRGYLAIRILAQNGFKTKNLSGGYKTWIAEDKEKRQIKK